MQLYLLETWDRAAPWSSPRGTTMGGKMKIAGDVTKLEMEGGEVNVKLKVTGTDHEGLLKTSSALTHSNSFCATYAEQDATRWMWASSGCMQ